MSDTEDSGGKMIYYQIRLDDKIRMIKGPNSGKRGRLEKWIGGIKYEVTFQNEKEPTTVSLAHLELDMSKEEAH